MIPRSQPPRLAHAQSSPATTLPVSSGWAPVMVVRRAPSVPVNPSFTAMPGPGESSEPSESSSDGSRHEVGSRKPSSDRVSDLLPNNAAVSGLTASSSNSTSRKASNTSSRATSQTHTPSVVGSSSRPTTSQSAPQTGASKMAAAAKRGLDVSSSGGSMIVYEDEHPLSEKNLKERDYQTLHILNHPFHLPNRWKLLRPLGQGAYGLVAQVQDAITGTPIAVKCITRVLDKVILAKRALREITLLRHFGDHDNLTGLVDMDYVWDGFNEIYLYMQPMEADLHQIIRSGQNLTSSHIQFFLYQLLRGMKYIHTANVIHRDLKPGNLLVNTDCELKICDFGLARGFRPVKGEQPQGDDGKLTEYVATRWYRAPEIMLSNRRYTTAIDVWSVGCILAELLGGKPFFKGNDYIDQLNLITGVLGTPDEETLAKVASEKACAYMRTLPSQEKKDIVTLLPDASPDAIDLITQLLQFDHTLRPSVTDALCHPYVSDYHDETDEPSCPEVFSKWEEVESLETIEELREAISTEIRQYREEIRAAAEESDDEEEGQEEDWLGMAPEDTDEALYTTPVPLQAPTLQSASFHDPATTASPPIETPHHENAASVSPTARSTPKGKDFPFPVQYSQPPSKASSQAGSAPRTREHSPGAPFTPLSEESFGAPFSRPGGRHSRRSSTHSLSGKRASSFLFGTFGGGMTPMTQSFSNHPQSQPSDGAEHLQQPNHVSSSTERERERRPSTHWRSRSRAVSQAGDLVLERLSSIEITDHDEKDRVQAVGKVVGLGGDAEIPPMTVSPREQPKIFAA